MPIVLDASAVVELLLRSPAAAAVESLIAAEAAYAPELLDVEVLSALARLERKGILTSPAILIDRLLTAPITRVEHFGLLLDAWKLRRSISLYDAFYVALAKRLSCPLVTADRRLVVAAGHGLTVTFVAGRGGDRSTSG